LVVLEDGADEGLLEAKLPFRSLYKAQEFLKKSF